MGISVVIMYRIQVRIYTSFKFLQFNWRTMLLYPLLCFPVLIVMGPLFLLWSYLKHGCLNMPAGHVMLGAVKPVSAPEPTLVIDDSRDSETHCPSDELV